MEHLLQMNGRLCSCGKIHSFSSQIISGTGVLARLPECAKQLGAQRVFVLSDRNTYTAAGAKACQLLEAAGFSVVCFSLDTDTPEPNEESVGTALLHYDCHCDLVVGVGSGVINDIGKLISAAARVPYIIVATAPSMDGYASATSSMTRLGLKVSLNTKAADVIIGDTDILCQAPLHMMKSGLGDMLAKYVSICEWRIAQVVTGEYYCEEIARLIRHAVKRCTDNAQGLLRREAAAAQAVFEGLVIGGVAMNYAGLSRPASGVEHYISHVLDMRGAAFGTPTQLHGIQCAVGTLEAVRLYEKLVQLSPSREQALTYAAGFDYPAWANQLRRFLGKGAEQMITLEEKEKKYDPERHAQRLEVILSHWQEILNIISCELPARKQLEQLLTEMEMPCSLSDIQIPAQQRPILLAATKDIRDKYVLSRLAWDLGVLEQLTTQS